MNYRPKLLTLLCALLCLAAPSTYAAERGDAVLIEGVTLIDGTGKPAQPNTWVLIEAGRFARISNAPLRVGRHVARVDGRGKFLIPGMMDVHIHLLGGGAWRDSSAQSDRAVDFDVGLRTLHGFLYYGFTTVYDAGNHPPFIMTLRDRERRGEIVSPRLFATGRLLSYPGSWSVGYAGIGVRDWPETIADLDEEGQRVCVARGGRGSRARPPAPPAGAPRRACPISTG